MDKQVIVVLDFGGQQNQLIAKQIREEKVYSLILPFNAGKEKILSYKPIGLVLTSKADCVSQKEYDETVKMLESLRLPMLYIAKTPDKLKSFLFNECKASANWDMNMFIQNAVEDLQKKVGNAPLLCALSGGVDSAVSAALIHKACPNLTCIFVDHGLMRKNEPEEVERVFKIERKMNFIKIDARSRFLNRLENVSEPEKKRKIIGEEFIRVFEDEAKKIGKVDYLVQGTIYPDIIESGIGVNAVVKSHHNVGGLPSVVDFKEIIEPLRELFKDEVRQCGLALGLPESIVMRQPFPGPGLGVRIIGEITREKINILQEADFIYRDEIHKAGLESKIWQYFAVLTGNRTVGVRNESRTYDYTVALRAVNSVDGMTAVWYPIPFDVLEKISRRIVSEAPHISRVVYDITSKPPATIEWE